MRTIISFTEIFLLHKMCVESLMKDFLSFQVSEGSVHDCVIEVSPGAATEGKSRKLKI